MNVGNSFGWGMGTHLAASYPYSADIGVGVVAYFESKGILRPIPIEIGFGTTLSFCILPSGCGRQNKFFFMKKWILLALLCAMLGACGKDSDSDSYRLKKATVKGAVMVYQSSDGTRGTRAGDDYPRFYTVDEAGNVKSIRFITDKGDTLDLCIAAVKSLAGRYMLLENLNLGFPRVLLVDTDTEYVYEVKGISNFDTSKPAFCDGHGDRYFTGWIEGGDFTVVKLNASNPDNLTVEPCLAEGQSVDRYWVDTDGVIYYEDGRYSKFKCPGGRIYTFEELLGVGDASVIGGHSGAFYVVTRDKIYKISLQEFNTLQAQVIWTIDNWDGVLLRTDVYCPNPKLQEHVDCAGYVFNEESNEVRRIELNEYIPSVREYYGWNNDGATNAFVTSESLFVTDSDLKKLYQISLTDYTVHVIDMVQAGYEITPGTISCDLTSPGLSFAGLRYADGKNVVGMVNEDGTVAACEKTATDIPIVSLVRLN